LMAALQANILLHIFTIYDSISEKHITLLNKIIMLLP
jgi:hypothetical protein